MTEQPSTYFEGWTALRHTQFLKELVESGRVGMDSVALVVGRIEATLLADEEEKFDWEYALRAPNGFVYIAVLGEDVVEDSTRIRRRKAGAWEDVP